MPQIPVRLHLLKALPDGRPSAPQSFPPLRQADRVTALITHLGPLEQRGVLRLLQGENAHRSRNSPGLQLLLPGPHS